MYLYELNEPQFEQSGKNSKTQRSKRSTAQNSERNLDLSAVKNEGEKQFMRRKLSAKPSKHISLEDTPEIKNPKDR